MRRLLNRIVPIAVFTAIGFAFTGFETYDSIKGTMTDTDWADSIATAVETDGYFVVGHNIIVANKIRCWSGGTQKKGLLGRVIKNTYVDCSTCKKVQGNPILSSEGECTVVRIYKKNE